MRLFNMQDRTRWREKREGATLIGEGVGGGVLSTYYTTIELSARKGRFILLRSHDQMTFSCSSQEADTMLLYLRMSREALASYISHVAPSSVYCINLSYREQRSRSNGMSL